MGLVGLVGGGYPAFASTALSTGDGTSTNPPHPLGQLAMDSSGATYMLCRTHSTAAGPGTLHTISSSISFGTAVILPASTGATGSILGVRIASSGGTTGSYGWFGVAGHHSVLGASTTGAAGARLFGSTATAGAVLDSSGGLPLLGIQTASSNASSLWDCHLAYPTITVVI